jgi:hypothetical protein
VIDQPIGVGRKSGATLNLRLVAIKKRDCQEFRVRPGG